MARHGYAWSRSGIAMYGGAQLRHRKEMQGYGKEWRGIGLQRKSKDRHGLGIEKHSIAEKKVKVKVIKWKREE